MTSTWLSSHQMTAHCKRRMRKPNEPFTPSADQAPSRRVTAPPRAGDAALHGGGTVRQRTGCSIADPSRSRTGWRPGSRLHGRTCRMSGTHARSRARKGGSLQACPAAGKWTLCPVRPACESDAVQHILLMRRQAPKRAHFRHDLFLGRHAQPTSLLAKANPQATRQGRHNRPVVHRDRPRVTRRRLQERNARLHLRATRNRTGRRRGDPGPAHLPPVQPTCPLRCPLPWRKV